MQTLQFVILLRISLPLFMSPCLFHLFRAMFIRHLSVYKEQWGRDYRHLLHHHHNRHNHRDILCFRFSYVLVCSLFIVVKNGLTVLKRWPAVVVQRDLSTQRFVLLWVLLSPAFFFPRRQNKRRMFNCVVFLISPASCLWNLLGWVTFEFCDISRSKRLYTSQHMRWPFTAMSVFAV